jgi:molybdopterin molybdotransferase
MSSELIALTEAREKILDKLSPDKETHWLGLSDAVSSVLAEAIYAPINVPGNDNSAMDGFAVRFADIKEGVSLRISQRIPAGKKAQPLEQGCAARIFTGAMLPPGADTVVIQEDCTFDDKVVSVTKKQNIFQGDNIRRAGQDIKAGALVFSRGHRLKAQDIGLLASLGLESVLSYQSLKIALVSTGDELLMPGEVWADGKIYNSNSFMLQALLVNAGFQVTLCQILADNVEEIKKAFCQAGSETRLYYQYRRCICWRGGLRQASSSGFRYSAFVAFGY